MPIFVIISYFLTNQPQLIYFMSHIDLSIYGIRNIGKIIHNPTYEELFQAEISDNNEGFEHGILTKTGAVAVKTGVFTGRSPKDRYILKDSTTEKTIWWDGNINKPVNAEVWNDCLDIAQRQLSDKDTLYVVDTFCGTNEETRLKVRFIMEVAWQAHFVTNMFIRPTKHELENYGDPDFVSINASKATNPKWREHNLNSDVFVLFNLTERIQIIGGTWYGGEMKKGIFSVMNYYLPLKVLPLCTVRPMSAKKVMSLSFSDFPVPEKLPFRQTQRDTLSEMMNTVGMMKEFLTLKVVVMPRRLILAKRMNRISGAQLKETHFLKM